MLVSHSGGRYSGGHSVSFSLTSGRPTLLFLESLDLVKLRDLVTVAVELVLFRFFRLIFLPVGRKNNFYLIIQ